MSKHTKFPPLFGGVSHFTTQAMSSRSSSSSFRTFIVPHDGPWTGSKSVQIWLKIEQNTHCWHPEMEIPSFSQRTGLGPVRKSYRWMGLRNEFSLGIRKKHIRIGNKFDCVEGVRSNLSKRSKKHSNRKTPRLDLDWIEGNGTRPDYLANRVPKKLRGHPGKKNCSEIEK